jgi:hypothetical protein
VASPKEFTYLAPTKRANDVARIRLTSRLDAALQTGLLRIVKELREAGPLAEERKNFQRSVSAAGRATYAARVGPCAAVSSLPEGFSTEDGW